MTPELTYLVWSAVLTFVLVLIAVSGATLEVGLPKLAANREDMPEMTGWAGRAQRAHRNMLENLILFAILVLVAKAAGVQQQHDAAGRAAVLLGPRGVRHRLYRGHPVDSHRGLDRLRDRPDPDCVAARGLAAILDPRGTRA